MLSWPWKVGHSVGSLAQAAFVGPRRHSLGRKQHPALVAWMHVGAKPMRDASSWG